MEEQTKSAAFLEAEKRNASFSNETAELLNRLAWQLQNPPQNPAAQQVVFDAAVHRLRKAAENMEGRQAELVRFAGESPDLQILQERIVQAQAAVQEASEKQRLFIDMDGTLARFQKVDTLETLYEEGYFFNLEPLPAVVEAVKIFQKENPDKEVYIMSSVLSDSSYALPEKNAWLDKYLPEIDREHRIFPPCGENKLDFVPGGIRPNDHLLDDYTDNLMLWEPPAKGIKLLNGINFTKGTWTGSRLSFQEEPAELAACIAGVMEGKEIKQTLQKTKGEVHKTAGWGSPRL